MKITKEEKTKRKEILDELNDITLFNGSLAEYERWKGYECEILGPSYAIPFSELDDEDLDMHKKGIEAIVNVQYFVSGPEVYDEPTVGLPVRKKK